MKIVLGLLFLYLFLPFIGLFTYNGFAGEVKTELKVLYGIYAFLELLIISSLVFLFDKNNEKTYFIYKYSFKSLFSISFKILIAILLINLFLFGNYKILIGEIGRGEFRTTLHLGFIYIFFVLYLTGAILALNAYFYSNMPFFLRKRFKKKLFLLFFIGLFIGFATGYKATAVMIMLIGLAGLSKIIKLKHLILLSLFFVGLMALSGYIFMNFNDFTQVLNYLVVRATNLTAESSIAIYNLYPNGGDNSYMILLYFLGNKLASLISGYSINSLEYLQIDLGRHIAYLIYPNSNEALSGAFNLTTTGFGEAIYLFGQNFYLIYLMIIIFIFILLIYLYQRATISLKITLLAYLLSSFVVGGGKITNILAITTFVYLMGVYFVIKIILTFSKVNNENIIHYR